MASKLDKDCYVCDPEEKHLGQLAAVSIKVEMFCRIAEIPGLNLSQVHLGPSSPP